MAGKKGCSGGYRPGAGRPAGSTAIKQKGQAKAKKKVVIDLEPSDLTVIHFTAMLTPSRTLIAQFESAVNAIRFESSFLG